MNETTTSRSRKKPSSAATLAVDGRRGVVRADVGRCGRGEGTRFGIQRSPELREHRPGAVCDFAGWWVPRSAARPSLPR